ncbi:MAG: cyclodeaminase/cyclohydrolase family protein [Mogibacterium sp.]|nr:cyclodeaminase/cyclohydrolase family protein [Mogibacterium sp.]
MSMTNNSIEKFLEDLKSSLPAPGGGGASGLVGAIGAALGVMVGSLTVGKKKYADVEEEIKELMRKASGLSDRLAACMDQDAEAFEPLAAAYGIPKDQPGRDETLEKCLRTAASVPLEIMELTCETIELLEGFAAKGSKLVISDAATGAVVCQGALKGAAINVKVNTSLMKDKEYAAGINKQVDDMLNMYLDRAEAVFQGIYGRYE